MKRDVVKIDEEKCNGCGNCVPGCPEGALQIIDGKARIVSDLLCDGIGACIGKCPTDAITVEKKETGAYDEKQVMVNIARQGLSTISAHLKHLYTHKQDEFLSIALAFLEKNRINVPDYKAVTIMNKHNNDVSECPGTKSHDFSKVKKDDKQKKQAEKQPSELTHWPIQLHLISPNDTHYYNSDLLLAADCVAFSMGNFHNDYLSGKKLTIACPKLDSGMEKYREKLTALIDEAKINTITVIIMQVPCCSGLLALVKQAATGAKRKVPIKAIVVGLNGEVLSEQWE